MAGAEEFLSSLLTGLEEEGLFPDVRLPADMTSLRRVEKEKGVRALLSIFQAANMHPKLGISMATGSISVTVQYPLEGDRVVGNNAQAVLWGMLNMVGAYQPMIESVFPYASFAVEGSPLYKTIPNICLHCFMRHTKVAVANIKPTLSQGKLTLYFGAARLGVRSMQTNRLCMDNREEPFWFLPSSFRLTGYDEGGQQYTQARVEEQIQQFQGSLVEELWASLWKGCYFPAQGLWEGILPLLVRYFQGFSFSPPRAKFLPNLGADYKLPVGIYLHGEAGVGKSSFVKALSNAMEELVATAIEPLFSCNVVRIPLNTVSVRKLRQILRVRGLSDWSVQRIMEQTLVRGGLVILHLEEMPADPDMQDEFMSALDDMFTELMRLYPLSRSKIWCMITSNYAPSERMQERLALSIEVEALEEKEQLKWCHRALTDTVERTTGVQVERIAFHKQPPISKDMRKLQTWRMSVGFHAAELAAQVGGEKVSAVLDEAGDDHVLLKVVNEERQEVGHRVLVLVNGVFAVDQQSGASDAARIDLLARMTIAQYLQPCVLLAVQPDREGFQTRVVEGYRQHCKGQVVVESAALFSEDDRNEFFGDIMNPVLTGVFRKIDNVTNPIYDRGDDCILFFIHTNAFGCFSIRELCESGKSRTHRTAVDKKRVVFVLLLDEVTSITDQILSRSHGIFLPSSS